MLLLLPVACLAVLSQTQGDTFCSCLPADIKSDMIVETITRSGPSGLVKQTVTIGDKLKKLKARCRRGKLIDARGVPVKFFRLVGCWGTPPPDYRQTIERQSRDLARLKRNNTVVEIPCNPDPLLPPMVARPPAAAAAAEKPSPGGIK